MDVLSIKETLEKMLTWIKHPKVSNPSSANETMYIAERTDTNVKIGFGVGSGGGRNGLWSYTNGRWLLFGEGTNTRLGHDNQSISTIYIGKYSVLDLVYPIGSIYMSTDETSPATLFGGTWEKIPVSRTLISAGNSSETAVYLVNATGGATSVDYTPAGTVAGTALTVAQMPVHDGHIQTYTGSLKAYMPRSIMTDYGSQGRGWQEYSGGEVLPASNNRGSGAKHDHGFTGTKASISTMQPWYAVYMWRRTA